LQLDALLQILNLSSSKVFPIDHLPPDSVNAEDIQFRLTAP
jgi:hypothetical protein